jgi:hypothetical protein
MSNCFLVTRHLFFLTTIRKALKAPRPTQQACAGRERAVGEGARAAAAARQIREKLDGRKRSGKIGYEVNYICIPDGAGRG